MNVTAVVLGGPLDGQTHHAEADHIDLAHPGGNETVRYIIRNHPNPDGSSHWYWVEQGTEP